MASPRDGHLAMTKRDLAGTGLQDRRAVQERGQAGACRAQTGAQEGDAEARRGEPEVRPHSSLGGLTPAGFGRNLESSQEGTALTS